MSRRDDLIREAFGETPNPGRKWTPAEAQEIERLRQAVSGLKSMRDVPEPQLSVERLRDAVLKTEMRQRGAGFRWPMIAAPAGLGVALVAFMALRPSAHRPVAYIADEAAPSAPSVALERSSPAPRPKVATAPALEARIEEPPPLAAGNGHRKPIARVTNTSNVLRIGKGATTSRSGGANAEPAELVASNAVMGPEPPIENLAPEATPDDVVVVIESRPDASTGSRSASEVEASSDVVIGG